MRSSKFIQCLIQICTVILSQLLALCLFIFIILSFLIIYCLIWYKELIVIVMILTDNSLVLERSNIRFTQTEVLAQDLIRVLAQNRRRYPHKGLSF